MWASTPTHVLMLGDGPGQDTTSVVPISPYTLVVMYSPELLDHFEHPRNAGEVASPDAHVRVENPACGDILELSARVQNGRLAVVRFKVKGCVPAMACGSLITDMLQSKPLSEAAAISRKEVVQQIGGLPPASGHAAQLAVDAVKALLRKLRAR